MLWKANEVVVCKVKINARDKEWFGGGLIQKQSGNWGVGHGILLALDGRGGREAAGVGGITNAAATNSYQPP